MPARVVTAGQRDLACAQRSRREERRAWAVACRPRNSGALPGRRWASARSATTCAWAAGHGL